VPHTRSPTHHVDLTHLAADGVEVGLVFGTALIGDATCEEEGAVDQAAELGFDVAVAVGGRADGCGEAAHGVGFVEQLAVAGVGEQQPGERHASHRLVKITAACLA